MNERTVTLRIRLDPDATAASRTNPERWDWHELLDLLPQESATVIPSSTYEDAIREARELQQPIEELANSEYARGQIALIAGLWGEPGMPTDDRMVEVAQDIYERKARHDRS